MNRLMEDKGLCRNFRQGNKSAMVAVYREYAPALVMFLKNGFMIQSRDGEHFFPGYRNDAFALENAIQEIFVRCFHQRARNAYDGVRPFKNYLFTIARNYVIDEFRKQLNRKDVAVAEMDTVVADEALNPAGGAFDAETLLQDAQLQELVRRFVAELNPAGQQVFQWRFKMGVSIEEAARTIGITAYRVKQIETEIRESFYRLLTAHGYLEGLSVQHPHTQSLLLLLLVVLWGTGGR